MLPKVLQRSDHTTSHLWLAIGGAVMCVIGLGVATCALMGLSVNTLVAMIAWEHVATISVIVVLMTLGNGLIFVAFGKNPDEVRRQMLDKQQRLHAEAIKQARRKSYDEGFTAGQAATLQAHRKDSLEGSANTPPPSKPVQLAPPATQVASDVIPPPSHGGPRPVVLATANGSNAN